MINLSISAERETERDGEREVEAALLADAAAADATSLEAILIAPPGMLHNL